MSERLAKMRELGQAPWMVELSRDLTDIPEKEGIQKFADPFNDIPEKTSNKSRELVS